MVHIECDKQLVRHQLKLDDRTISMTDFQNAIVGSILGTAVGDAIGLAYEGLSPQRGARLFGEPDRYRLLLCRGMVSDDTEHACMTMQALIASGDNADEFARKLAWSLRCWLLGAPAGIGFATLRAAVRLWIGFSPSRSGVFSAGNGPAMRSTLLGVSVEDLAVMQKLVRASTRLKHTDPKAELGAQAVALAARMASRNVRVEPEEFLKQLNSSLLFVDGHEEFLSIMDKVMQSIKKREPTDEFLISNGMRSGITGYMYQTVPAVLHMWLTNQGDFRSAVMQIVRCGGDTDTTAAIVGGIIGGSVGKAGIPKEWLNSLWEWPRTVSWMEQLSEQLSCSLLLGKRQKPLRLPAYGVIPRNLVFAGIVLAHGFRRLLPPY